MEQNRSFQTPADQPKKRELTLEIERLEERIAPAYFSLSLTRSFADLANKAGPLDSFSSKFVKFEPDA